jgi:hypothetical protein
MFKSQIETRGRGLDAFRIVLAKRLAILDHIDLSLNWGPDS